MFVWVLNFESAKLHDICLYTLRQSLIFVGSVSAMLAQKRHLGSVVPICYLYISFIDFMYPCISVIFVDDFMKVTNIL